MNGADRGSIDLNLWGKSHGLCRPYPLVCHLLDTAAMAITLWHRYLPSALRRSIAERLGTTEGDAGRLIAFWAGLHDIAKCIPCFQAMDSVAYQNLQDYPEVHSEKRRHEHAAHVWLGRALAEQVGYEAGSVRSSAFVVAQLLGGHHGRFLTRDHRECRFPAVSLMPELGAGKWEEQRLLILDAIIDVLTPPPAPDAIGTEAAALACGIIILADWLVSQDDHLTQRLPETPGSSQDLEEHYRRSLQLAPSLLQEAGLTPVRLREASFAEEFPYIQTPNDLQRSVAEMLPGLLGNGPGLLLVTAPMGVGKTEVAFHGARLLGDACGTPGFLFGLPTMATADQMYGRARAYGEHQAEGDAALTLLHSMSWLNDAYTGTGTAPAVISNDVDVTAPDWLHGRKRGLLASMAVGTIDQALLAALPLKHLPLRLLGLAGKVLIVDEVHAYDAYMQGLLGKSLTWLGRLGVPVVLMSATLPTRIASRLIAAYLRGAGHQQVDLPPIQYPGWSYADASTGKITPFPVQSEPRDLHLQIQPVAVTTSGLDRSEALRTLLAPALDEGGCVGLVCNTVAEAQETYVFLRDWFAKLPDTPELTLLHARFPARRREAITKEIIAKFGKCTQCPSLAECEHRPQAAVLVATQVIEQSLDLDFDLMISDLAPIALLLQRAGRCQRHAGRKRPSWAAKPQLAVLRPTDAMGELALPRSWPFIYSPSLLRRTDAQLQNRVIAIPDDIQDLVERVYDDAFTDGHMSDEDLEWIGQEIAQWGMADLVAIPDPEAVAGLHQLTSSDVSEDMIATRFGADSARILFAYRGPDGGLYLDANHSVKLPDTTKLPRHVIKRILAETIPVRASLLKDRDASNEPPASWANNAWLRDLVVIPLQIAESGQASGRIGERLLELSADLGLRLLRRASTRLYFREHQPSG
ncbi:CRISPR-associated helicase Cas3' [Nonomuraea sp. 3N208]|uniref:CRISPR-associated helicase Cas3' n=1 Tax=Nonomuraea sp. 3N208 TaxID=3457421 RepID=UPI003FD522C2